jgi:tetraacyldisaccharide 4'-kinase
LNNQIKHIALYPFSLIYGLITGIRNWLFDKGILASTSFEIPIICIGNLSVGGTGKTPHTEFILNSLQSEWKTAVLSRGYKRKSNGFYLAFDGVDSLTIGDEPYQIHKKFPEIPVAVDEKRVHGVKMLQERIPGLELIVLDDAFQHRYIHAGFSILLTDFSNLYNRDLLLPAGTLREWKSGSKRADIIVVTKCPNNLKPIDIRLIETELNLENNQSLFFSSYIYDEIIPVFPENEPENWTFKRIKGEKISVLLVTGIAYPKLIFEQIKRFNNNIDTVFFEDHHDFQKKDYALIMTQFDALKTDKKLLIVTEKDAARIIFDSNFPETLKSRTYALPIRVEILHKQETLFIQKIKNYVVENSRNC